MKKLSFFMFSVSLLLLFSYSAHAESWKDLIGQADSLSRDGDIDSAIVITKAALEKVEGEFGKSDTTVASVLSTLGKLYRRQANYAEAEPFYKRALAIREKAFGPDHPNVAQILHNLANLYSDQHKYAEAELHYQRALVIMEKTVGPEDPEVARILNDLGFLYDDQGKYTEAELFYQRALAIREKSLGPEHPKVASSLNNLAIIYSKQGKYAKAEPLYQRALAIREKALGPDHAKVAQTLNNLAILYRRKGKYAKAEPLYQRALAIREKGLDPNHPKVAASLHNLAVLYDDKGEYAEAESLYQRSLTIYEKTFGLDHPKLVSTLNGLAILYSRQGRYAEAELLYKRTLVIREKAFGPDHPKVAQILNNMGILCRKEGRYVEAESLYKRALAVWEKALGPQHTEVATVLNNLGGLYSAQEMYSQAEPLHKRALAIWEKTLGPDHQDVATSLNNLANVCYNQGRYSQAEPLYSRALAIWEKKLGPDHPGLARSLYNLALLYQDSGQYAKADLLYQRALNIREKAFGPDNWYVAQTLEAYSQLLRLQKNEVKGLEMAERASRIRRKNFVDNSIVLSERDALAYTQYWRFSVDNYLNCYLGLGASDLQIAKAAANIILSTKGQVSDEVFERQKSLITETDSTTLALAEALTLTKFTLSRLYVQGPDEDVEGYRNGLDSLSRRANELEANLACHSASFRKRQDYKEISFDRISSLLPESSVLVEYLKYNFFHLKPFSALPRYLALVVTRDNGPVIVDLCDASELDPLVGEYRRHVLRVSNAGKLPTVDDLADYKKISQELYRQIWAPIEKYVVDQHLVLIAPDGALNIVSFAGLTGGDGKYLIENSLIHYLSSGRDLIRLQDETDPGRGLFALGDPDYNASVAARLSATTMHQEPTSGPAYATQVIRSAWGKLQDIRVNPLPGTRREVERVAARWENSTDEPAVVYIGSSASEERFKREVSGSRVVHLATHGYFLEGASQPDFPKGRIDNERGLPVGNPLLLSGLLLAGANLHGEGANRVAAEDGILTAYEISAVNLEGTELVVLSACETGLGEVKEGEGVYGLRRAFQMAGARTIITSLWPIPDATTAETMYKLYRQTDLNLAEALSTLARKRLSDLRGRGQPDHPYNWASFIAIGDWKGLY